MCLSPGEIWPHAPRAHSKLVLWSVSLPFPFFSCKLGTRSNPLVSPMIEIHFCVTNIELPLQVKYGLMHPEPIVGSCTMEWNVSLSLSSFSCQPDHIISKRLVSNIMSLRLQVKYGLMHPEPIRLASLSSLPCVLVQTGY